MTYLCQQLFFSLSLLLFSLHVPMCLPLPFFPDCADLMLLLLKKPLVLLPYRMFPLDGWGVLFFLSWQSKCLLVSLATVSGLSSQVWGTFLLRTEWFNIAGSRETPGWRECPRDEDEAGAEHGTLDFARRTASVARYCISSPSIWSLVSAESLEKYCDPFSRTIV